MIPVSKYARFSLAKAVPGTCEYHCFTLTVSKELTAKRISTNDTTIQTAAFI